MAVTMNSTNGRIIKSVGGFFHVESPDGVLLCNARGLFRLRNITPVAGDYVTVEITDGSPLIVGVHERKNHIVRPPLANIDAAVIVVSTTEPVPNLLVLDKLIAIFESKDIEPVLLFTKTDKLEDEELRAVYAKAGFTVLSISNETGEGVRELREFLLTGGKTSAFIGNTGVGKSSTLNSLFPELGLETAEISKKLGRGKHTTRTVQLYTFSEPADTAVADTPGFSTVEAAKYGKLPSEDVALCFREFVPFHGKCKFGGCRHIKEDGCAVIAARDNGIISASRFDNYVRIYEEARTEERNYK
jgi:ribosome biogenesis GTPase